MADLNYGGNSVSNASSVTRSGFNDYLMPALTLAATGPTIPPLTTFRNGLMAPAYAGTGGTVNEAFGTVHILHDYVPGSTIYFHVHWSHIIGAPSGNVVWQIEYSLQKGHDQGAFPASATIELVQAAGAQYTHQIIEHAGITDANIEPDTIILFRIFRDPAHASDTFTGNAYLFYVDLHVSVDNRMTVGKVAPFVKIS